MDKTNKFVLVFFITLGIFGVAYLISQFFYNERIAQVKSIEDTINRNMLESEVQYALLADAACDTGDEGSPLLINEITTLGQKLSFMEEARGINDPEVISLKKDYSLLEIKDYLLLKERARQCGEKPMSILYFYSNMGDCADCKKMGFVLTNMREDYDKLHIYAFDYNLGLTTIETLKSIYKLDSKLPILVINRQPYYGFKTRTDIEKLIPELVLNKATTTKATSTKATTTKVK